MLKYGMPVQTLCSWNVPVFKRKVIGATILCTLCCRESGRCQEVFGKGNQIYFVFKDPTPHSSSVFASVISALNKLRSDLTKFLAKVLFVQQNNKGRETFFHPLGKTAPTTSKLNLNRFCLPFLYSWRFLWLAWFTTYRAFRGLGKAKFADGGSILSSSQFSLLTQMPLKTMLNLKVVKINSKIIISLH